MYVRKTGGPNASQYFHICYQLKTPAEPIPAEKNYWGNQFGSTISLNTTPLANCFLRNKGDCIDPTTGMAVAMNFTPMFPYLLNGCHFEERPCTGTSAECIPDCTTPTEIDGETSIGEQFRTGFANILSENFTDAKEAFDPVAALFGAASAGFETHCRSFVETARSLTDGFSAAENFEHGDDRQAAKFERSIDP